MHDIFAVLSQLKKMMMVRKYNDEHTLFQGRRVRIPET